ncbi:SDR family oxidoreductase [Candidatus Uabimicrobium amorphum]|uniref:Dihydromonapterin reductase n=1 Tax=Uabimicrobium amorphum TaxID=2596890 RepID=A0A5S9F294_UABAM|nr:SDR family oxidoreductase [Candidatus Uabimicrobium amorphum]BBM83228.1 pteridine reductase 1 [Candidatus Uabimicrobium amorphum]
MENAIFITGCTRRIGLHLTKRFLDEGYDVIAHYRKMTPELEVYKNRNTVVIRADLTSPKDIDSMVDQLQRYTRSLRAIIHNASFYEKTSDDLSEAIKQYQTFFNVHMLAPFLINHKFYPLLTRGEGPRDIIHITDTNAQNPDKRFCIYSSTKAGLENLTKSFAKNFAPQVKVNSIAPGPIVFSKRESEEQRKAILAKTLLKKEGGMESVFQAVKGIMNNDFITGTCVCVDGGRSLG